MTLDELLADVFHRLSDGVADRGSAFRSPALGSVDAAGAPSIRTVVLRGFDPASRLMTVHTDLRAAKAAQVRANPLVVLHVWDSVARVQLRIAGRATLHAACARARTEWGRLHRSSRATYAVVEGPGTPLTGPATVERLLDDTAFTHFAVIDIAMLSLEWLLLAPDGHRRACFTFGDPATAAWLVP